MERKEGAAVMCDGRLFHRRAAATGNAQSPTVDRRVCRTSRDVDEAERSRLASVSAGFYSFLKILPLWICALFALTLAFALWSLLKYTLPLRHFGDRAWAAMRAENMQIEQNASQVTADWVIAVKSMSFLSHVAHMASLIHFSTHPGQHITSSLKG